MSRAGRIRAGWRRTPVYPCHYAETLGRAGPMTEPSSFKGRAGIRSRVERIWAGWSSQKPLRSSPGLGPDPLQDPQSGFPGWAGGARGRKAVDGHAPPNSVGKAGARTARRREATAWTRG